MVFIIIVIVIVLIAACIYFFIMRKRVIQDKLLQDSLNYMKISFNEISNVFASYNERIIVKSRQRLEKYDYLYYFKENRDSIKIIENFLARKKEIINLINFFIKDNPFKNEKEYKFIENKFKYLLSLGNNYIIRVDYVTKANNNLASKNIVISNEILNKIVENPNLYVTKMELKEIEKNKLEEKKKGEYCRVNGIIDTANSLKNDLINKNKSKELDDLIAQLFDRTVNSIQKIKKIDGDEWNLIDGFIENIESKVNIIKKRNDKLLNYYQSDDFNKIKETCSLLMQSQKEFNEYIEQKIESVSKMFGTRTVRNETQQDDVYNYVRAYKKTISPFTAEVSSAVFASSENNPIQYLIKLFYPDKSLYEEQICNLKNLLNELDALKDAREIINNYKKEYAKYIENVPKFVLDEDEDGFYSRLGFAIIDENTLNVEYKIAYTSGGGMAQRSFTITMDEENIVELINNLQSKLTTASLAKEQRALMTSSLRLTIKERDNYTCCNCGNSIKNEPNLLLEIDHIIPISKGGLTIESNLQTLCWKCNRSKGSKLI